MEKDKEDKTGRALISVIIPVYNVMSYLNKCIKSVIDQTYKNLEILLINDGSNDGSEIVCNQYEKLDSRIRVFHKSNGGLSSARNYGLKYATGDYIGFIDSDDYIDIKMYEHLIEAMREEVDLVACGVRDEYIKRYKRKYCASNFTYGYQIMDNCEAMRELLLLRAFGFSVGNKLFKRKLFDNIVFPEGRSSEDLPVTYEIFRKIKYAVNNGYADYHYVHRPESITGGDFFEGRLDFCYYTKEILNNVSIDYPQYKNEAMTLYIKSAYSIMNQILSSSNKWEHQKTYKMLRNILVENEKVVRESSYIDEGTRKDMMLKLKLDLDKGSKEINDKAENNLDKVEKLSEFYNILLQWISLKEKGITVGDFIRRNGYRTVAIYGLKELGELLYDEMKNCEIHVTYIIDQFKDPIFIDVPVLRPDELLPPVDVIIVTAIHYFQEIKKTINNKVTCPVYSLEDVLFFEYE